MEQQQQTHDQDEEDMKRRIHDLELEVQSFRSRCLLLESMLERERQDRIRAETRAESYQHQQEYDLRRDRPSMSRRESYSQRGDSISHSHTQGISEQRHSERPSGKRFSITQIITQDDLPDPPLTCGNCTLTGPCACAEEVLASASSGCGKCGSGSSCQCFEDVANAINGAQDLKRSVSPAGLTSNPKRYRLDNNAGDEGQRDSSTTNITQQLHIQPSQATSEPTEPISIKDSCGFCNEGSYCACADVAAMATPVMTPTETLLPVMSHQTQTPPPSETDVVLPPIPMEMTSDGAVKLPRRAKRSKPDVPQGATSKECGANGPGTCAQCQADPKSGLFCRLMSAKFDNEEGGSAGGCCGKKGAGGCCKTTAEPAPEKITLPRLGSLGLTYAQAYQTLSSHRNFEQAADDIGSWLPKLKATPRPDMRAKPPGRGPVEVEAASIMSVLKEFDVRFGREV